MIPSCDRDPSPRPRCRPAQGVRHRERLRDRRPDFGGDRAGHLIVDERLGLGSHNRAGRRAGVLGRHGRCGCQLAPTPCRASGRPSSRTYRHVFRRARRVLRARDLARRSIGPVQRLQHRRVRVDRRYQRRRADGAAGLKPGTGTSRCSRTSSMTRSVVGNWPSVSRSSSTVTVSSPSVLMANDTTASCRHGAEDGVGRCDQRGELGGRGSRSAMPRRCTRCCHRPEQTSGAVRIDLGAVIE